MSEIAAALDGLMAIATKLNYTPGPHRRITAETWLAERGDMAREIARTVGRLRKELGIAAPTSFAALQADTGLSHVRQRGRAIPVERRSIESRVVTRSALLAARDAL